MCLHTVKPVFLKGVELESALLLVIWWKRPTMKYLYPVATFSLRLLLADERSVNQQDKLRSDRRESARSSDLLDGTSFLRAVSHCSGIPKLSRKLWIQKGFAN